MDITLLPPYVTPEHALILEEAERTLHEYQEALIARLQLQWPSAYAIEPHPGDLERAREEFRLDPVRMWHVRFLCDLKLMYERPCFSVSAEDAKTFEPLCEHDWQYSMDRICDVCTKCNNRRMHKQ